MVKDSPDRKVPRHRSCRLLLPHLIDCESLERVHPLARQLVDVSKNDPQVCQKHSFRHGGRGREGSGNSKRDNDLQCVGPLQLKRGGVIRCGDRAQSGLPSPPLPFIRFRWRWSASGT